MTVGAESKMGKVQHRRRAGHFLERARIAFGGGDQIFFFHRHCVDLFGTERRVRQQTFAQMREIAIRIAGRSSSP